MTDSEFDLWAGHHITALNLPANWHAVILTFQPTLAAFNATLAEAKAATLAIRMDPKFNAMNAGWQIQALIRSIEEARGRAVRELIKRNQERHPEHTGERSVCETCDGSGLVIVPHLCCVSNSEWVHPFATFAVACICPLGGYKLSHTQEHTGKFRIMGLGGYQRKNDLWMQQMADRARAQGALDRAINEAATLRPGDLEFLKAKIGSQVGSGRKSA